MKKFKLNNLKFKFISATKQLINFLVFKLNIDDI